MIAASIGFVTGLTAEAKLLANTGFSVAVGGGTPAGAARAATRLADAGVLALVSFGLAGGLSSTRRPGDVLVPARVVGNDLTLGCDLRLSDWLGGVNTGDFLAGTEIAVTAARKSALYAAHGAEALDLESGAVAVVAAARGIPFAILRAVADPAWRDLAPAALIALDRHGRIGMLAVLASVLRQPGQIPSLVGLAGDAARARTALRKRVLSLDPAIFPN